jgi:hypothetical protein
MGLFNELGKALKHGEDEQKKSGTKNGVQGLNKAGYAKIAAWMKRTYKGRISGAGDPLQRNLDLEQLSAEACSGLSAKAKKGFMDYLKKQNYEPLLK